MQAIILSGGKGQRLSPFTNICPKGMLRIENKPILEYQIEWLKKSGTEKVVFACGYLGEMIKNYFGNGNKFSILVEYSEEKEPLGRGGAIKKAWEKITTDEPIVVLNGDIITEMDLKKMLDEHSKQKNILGTIYMVPYKSPYGIVRVDESGIVQSFEEKRALPYWVNGGIYIFETGLKNQLPDIGDHETETFPILAKERKLYGYKSNDYWKGIDTVKDLNEFAVDTKNLQVIK